MKKQFLLLTLVLCLVSASALFSQQFSNKGKKLIEYGWDVHDVTYIRDNVATIEKYPFDGVVFTLNKTHAFDLSRWTKEELKPQYDAIRSIKWKKFTDNFLILHSANKSGMDWFNDKHWETILANASDFASVARAGKCVGIIFDPEPYGPDPWAYPTAFGNHEKSEVTDQLRKRGKQWVQALQKNWPEMKLLSFFFTPDQSHPFGAFCTGLIEGARGNVKIIDGNENSYYHTSYSRYVDDWNKMTVSGAKTIDPKLRKQFDKHFQAGMALYVDQSMALREPLPDYISSYMSPEDRLKYFEATVYWALKTTDEYVWCYSEKMDWWTGWFPKGLDEAISRAKAKLEAGEGLGYSLEDRVKNATRDRAEQQSK